MPDEQREDGEVEQAEADSAEAVAAKRRDPHAVSIVWFLEPKHSPDPDAVDPNVAVSLVVRAGREKERVVPLGELNADSDSGPPGVQNCGRAKFRGARSVQACGATPLYNAFAVVLKNEQIVVTRIVEVDGDPSAKRSVVVKRIPVPGATKLSLVR